MNCGRSTVIYNLDRYLHRLNHRGAFVYFMQTGFAMLTAGSVRSKNVKNILLWNLLDSCGGALAFYSVGYAFAYGGTGTFIGNTEFFLVGSDYGERN